MVVPGPVQMSCNRHHSGFSSLHIIHPLFEHADLRREIADEPVEVVAFHGQMGRQFAFDLPDLLHFIEACFNGRVHVVVAEQNELALLFRLVDDPLYQHLVAGHYYT